MRLGSGQGHSVQVQVLRAFQQPPWLPGTAFRGFLPETAGSQAGQQGWKQARSPGAGRRARTQFLALRFRLLCRPPLGRETLFLAQELQLRDQTPITTALNQGSCPQPVGCGLSHTWGPGRWKSREEQSWIPGTWQ